MYVELSPMYVVPCASAIDLIDLDDRTRCRSFCYFNTLDHIRENTTPQNIIWCQKMDLSGIPPPKMDWESTNLPEAWKKFQQHVDLIF